MKGANLPGTLPMLPGNVYADPTITRYHKTQLLGVKDGAIQGKCMAEKTGLAGGQRRLEPIPGRESLQKGRRPPSLNLTHTRHVSILSIEKTINLKEDVDQTLIQSMRQGGVTNLSGVPRRQG